MKIDRARFRVHVRVHCEIRVSTVVGERKNAHEFSWTNFVNTLGSEVRDIAAKFPGHPRFLFSKPKEDKLSRESTNFSATTHSRGKTPTPPHWAVSRPKKVNLCVFFSCLSRGGLLWGPRGAFYTEIFNFRGHFRGHLRVYTPVCILVKASASRSPTNLLP